MPLDDAVERQSSKRRWTAAEDAALRRRAVVGWPSLRALAVGSGRTYVSIRHRTIGRGRRRGGGCASGRRDGERRGGPIRDERATRVARGRGMATENKSATGCDAPGRAL